MKKRILASLMSLLMVSNTAVLASGEAPANEVDLSKDPQTLLYSTPGWPTAHYYDVNNPNGWDVDRRGGEITQLHREYISMLDTSEEYAITMWHDIESRTSGKITLETTFKFLDNVAGFSFDMLGEDGKSAVKLITENGDLAYVSGKRNIKVADIEESQWMPIKIIADLDNRTAELAIRGVLIGTFPFSEDIGEINQVRLKTPEEKEMAFQFKYMRVVENYLVYESFLGSRFPYDWECIPDNEKAVEVVPFEGRYSGIVFPDLVIKDDSIIKETLVRKVFDKAEGNIIFEFRFLRNEKSDGMKFRLKNENQTALELGISGENLVNAKGEVLTHISDYMYHILRMEANTETKKVLVKYNARKLIEVPFDEDAEFVDRIEFATSVTGKGGITIRDVVAYLQGELPSDYPTEPVVPKDSDDITTVMMSCDLWNEATNGWDNATAYDYKEPYLGWYDETKPEAADWQTKWMVEHGIDAEMKCWYTDEGEYKGKPIRPIENSSALNAFFNSKYSDYLKTGMIVCWSPHPSNPVGQWRNTIIPYWIEQYFTDDRYLVIDNKPVVYILSPAKFVSAFGSEERTKEEFEYLRNECRKVGFDGVYLVALCQNLNNASNIESAEKSGFDNAFIYSWGRESYKADHQIGAHEKRFAWDTIRSIPVLSMGYCDEDKEKDYVMQYATSETFKEVAEYIKYDLMPRYEDDDLASKMVAIDNWNEWGEGHYINPSKLNGFGYLDVIREVFSDGGEHTDDIPTENQKSRLDNRRANDRRWMSYVHPADEKKPTKVLKGWYFNNPDDADDWTIEKQIDELSVKDGALTGKTIGKDAGIILKEDQKLDITYATYIKVRFKTDGVDSDVEEDTEVFYTTEENNKWTQAQAMRASVEENGLYNDYYFNVGSLKTWDGKLNKIRYDVSRKADTSFSIESIEILEDDGLITLFVDGKKQDYKSKTKNINGTVFVPTKPLAGYQDALECAVIYRNADKTVTVTHKDAEMKFTIGSDIAILNGKEYTLAAPIEKVNGLVNLPIRFIAEAIGAQIAWNGETRSIEITTKKEPEPISDYDISTRVPYEYEFELKNDFEGWEANTNSTFSRAKVADGVLFLRGMTSDPQIYLNTTMDASKYKTLTVRLKNETDKDVFQVFWASTEAGGISAENSAKINISTKDEDFVEYAIDLSSVANWKGTITKLRIDPTNGMGVVSLDYIRFTE